jgi:cell division septal protein FtsQ
MVSLKKSRKRLSRLRRAPKIFVPTPFKRQIVIPFKPLSLVLIIVLLATSVYFFFQSDPFQVRSLDFEFEESVNGAALPDEALVRQCISEEVLGRSALFLNSNEVEERIKQEFLTVRAIEIVKKLPSSLLIKVSVRTPLARVRGQEGELLVDAEGLLFREASSEDLPIIDLGEAFSGSLGEVVGGEGVGAYLDALEGLSGKGLIIVSISLKPGTIELEIKDGPVVLFSVEKDIAGQVEVLAQILKRYKIAGRVPGMVDLRFTRPVVRF